MTNRIDDSVMGVVFVITDLLTLYLVYAVIWWPGILIVAYGAYLLMQRDQFTFVCRSATSELIMHTTMLLLMTMLFLLDR